MSFYADLHIHSKYSRATSKDCDLENLALWGRKKGITVIGTGDFTHPAWIQELREKLIPAEPGLFRLREDLERELLQKLPASCQGTTRFMLSVEISTIYKKGDKTRKVHHLIYAPSLEQAETINRKLEKIGNIRSDGRPILGLDSRHLLEIVLEAGEGAYLVPAHIWTPWFSVLGSKSGFDRVADCYGDLASHVFALETGLSSDPEMNWKVSSLDRYRLMSNSDAHSPQKLGREANQFDCALDYFAMKASLETGENFGGTVEFFPEEGKYHLDGHRNCGVCLTPEQSKAHQGICPACKKPLTLGVLYRVEELADRQEGERPDTPSEFQNLIPLPEMISELLKVGPGSKAVGVDYEKLLQRLGPELSILRDIPLEEIEHKSSLGLLPEAISRMRKGEVIRKAGFDGEYGIIRLFQEEELKRNASLFFEFEQKENLPPTSLFSSSNQASEKRVEPQTNDEKKPPSPALDSDQLAALQIIEGALLITAGPGSGKTRTLTHRIAHLIREKGVLPQSCLTITFTRKAAEEMRERLQKLLPKAWHQIPVMTFHAFALTLLQENRKLIGLNRGFRIASDEERKRLLMQEKNLTEKKAAQWLRQISEHKRNGREAQAGSLFEAVFHFYEEQCFQKAIVDYDDVLILALKLLEENEAIRLHYQQRYAWISIDEYQDIDPLQYRLVRLLCPENPNLCAIGDPDQSIYSFRGSDVGFFLRFEQDFPQARKISLKRNYRSGQSIVGASSQVILPSSLRKSDPCEAEKKEPGKIVIHESPTDKAEAEFIVHSIEKMIGGTSFFSLDSRRTQGESEQRYGFSDFAILYRTDAQAALLEEALSRAGFPFQRHSHRKLSENPLVQELISILEAQDPPSDLSALLEQAFSKISGMPANLIEGIYEVAQRCNHQFQPFLLELSLEQEIDLWDPRADRISLLTLHASKGLEFPVVFLAGCEERIIPFSWKGALSEAELSEERRLFYVGMTRAQERLFLCLARKRLLRGNLQDQMPSRFLLDIEKKLVEEEKTILKKKKSAEIQQLNLF